MTACVAVGIVDRVWAPEEGNAPGMPSYGMSPVISILLDLLTAFPQALRDLWGRVQKRAYRSHGMDAARRGTRSCAAMLLGAQLRSL